MTTLGLEVDQSNEGTSLHPYIKELIKEYQLNIIIHKKIISSKSVQFSPGLVLNKDCPEGQSSVIRKSKRITARQWLKSTLQHTGPDSISLFWLHIWLIKYYKDAVGCLDDFTQ